GLPRSKALAAQFRKTLTWREYFVMRKVYVERWTLGRTGAFLNVTESRASQIMTDAIKKIGKYWKKLPPELNSLQM
ncbi:MAG: sigma factor-like helix-turn-helix DNA-binding protein, partial [archaeon]